MLDKSTKQVKILALLLVCCLVFSMVSDHLAGNVQAEVVTEGQEENTEPYVTDYNICIGGTPVTSENAADVLKDETVVYDAENRIVTVSGSAVEIQGADYGIAVTGEAVTIAVEGELKIIAKEAVVKGNVTFAAATIGHSEFKGGEDEASATEADLSKLTEYKYLSVKNSGECKYTYKFEEDGSWKGSCLCGVEKNGKISVTPYKGTYDGKGHILASVDMTTIPDNAKVTYSTDGKNYGDVCLEMKDAGEKDVWVKVTSGNNIWTKKYTAVINKKQLNVSVKDITINKGQKMPELSVKIEGFVTGEEISSVKGFETPTASYETEIDTTDTKVNEFKVVFSGGNPTDNYVFTYKTKAGITINQVEILPEDYIILNSDGEKTDITKWQKTDLVIKPAGEDVKISADGTEWLEKLVISEDGKDKNYSFCLKKKDGTITETTTLTYNLDKKKPTGYIMLEKGNAQETDIKWEMFLKSPVVKHYFKEQRTISITALDESSGIENVFYYFSKEKLDEEKVSGNDISWKVYSGETKPVLVADDNYFVYAKIEDKAGNSIYLSTDGIIVENQKPVITQAEPSDEQWTRDEIYVTVKAEDTGEVQSGVEKVFYCKENGEKKEGNEATLKEDGTYTFTIAKQNYEGNYIIWCVDKAGNVSDEKIVSVKMDIEAPVINEKIEGIPENWTNKEILINGIAQDSKEVQSGIENIFYRRADATEGTQAVLKENGNFTFTIQEQNYEGNYIIWCADKAGNVSEEKVISVKMDITAPKVMAEPDKKGWTNEDVVVNGTAEDIVAEDVATNISLFYYKGSDSQSKIPLELKDGKISFTIPAQAYEGTYKVVCVDEAGNQAESEFSVKMDNVAPAIEKIVAAPENWTNGNVKITGTAIDLGEAQSKDVKIYYYPEGKSAEETEIKDITVSKETGKVDFSVEIAKQNYQGSYVFYCKDGAGNSSEVKTAEVKMSVNSPKMAEPTVSNKNWTKESVKISGTIEKADADVVEAWYVKGESGDKQEITLKETKKGSYKYEFKIAAQTYDGEYTILCKDEAGNQAEKVFSVKMDNVVPAIENIKAEPEGWTNDTVTISGVVKDDKSGISKIWYKYNNIKSAVESVGTDGKFEIKVEVSNFNGKYTLWCVDNAGNESEIKEAVVQVDSVKPEVVAIDYSEPVLSLKDSLLKAITFGFYKPASENKVTVTFTTTDPVTGKCASGISKIYWKYVAEDGVSTNIESSMQNFEELNGDAIKTTVKDNITYATATIELDKDVQYRGYICAYAEDNAHNVSDTVNDESYIIVSDTKIPTGNISYSPAQSEEGENLYYQNSAIITCRINEANFYQEDVEITLVELNSKKESKPATTWTKTSGTDEYVTEFTVSGEGNYKVKLEYTDKSGNKMKSCESKMIIIDGTRPEIAVNYTNKNVIAAENGRNYFGDSQRAVITIKETNFNPADVQVMVKATNVMGEALFATDGNGYVSDYWNKSVNSANWSNDGNVHTLILDFPADANYSFKIAYKDRANNSAADYAEDLFTVDKTPVTNLKVDYSTSVFQNVLEAVTFGYYKAQMKVTISAEDETSGVNRFVYSYQKEAGVSNVNSELINAAIGKGEINYNGKVATTAFYIPKTALENTSQFNGTVAFTAYDKAENSTAKTETTRIIVDNISPVATVTYNQPVQEVNGISYYAGDIEATILINEANFYAEDVQLMLTKDGVAYPVNVNWINNSVDEHTGTFTLTEDGDYVITIQYADRSKNEMSTYTSNQLTLDTQIPTVSVSNIKNNSANTDEVYGFTVTASDINIDAANFKPVLNAVVKDAEGNLVTKQISLGNMQTVTEGETYAYTVDNLEEDAIYTLSCNVSDKAGNKYEQLVLNSDGQTYENVQFSVNRKGSTYSVAENTQKLIQQYYVQKVNEDVVIVEVNADILKEYSVTLNGKTLQEGTDYTVEQSGGNGTWISYKYIIKAELFESEGEYQIVISSTDKADNNAYSDVKATKVNFVVDRTAPVVSLSGLADNGSYQTDKQKVTVIPTDDGGALYSLNINLVDKEGKVIENLIDLKAEELEKALEDGNGQIEFYLNEGLNQYVAIQCADKAMNETGESNVYQRTYKNVSVSASQFMLYWANKPLRYGVLGGFVVVIAGVSVLLVLKKKKGKKSGN